MRGASQKGGWWSIRGPLSSTFLSLDPGVGCVLERGEEVWSASADEACLDLVIQNCANGGVDHRHQRRRWLEIQSKVRVTSPTATVLGRRPKQVGCLVGAVIVAHPLPRCACPLRTLW